MEESDYIRSNSVHETRQKRVYSANEKCRGHNLSYKSAKKRRSYGEGEKITIECVSKEKG